MSIFLVSSDLSTSSTQPLHTISTLRIHESFRPPNSRVLLWEEIEIGVEVDWSGLD
jgi:hypothetical protein